MLESVVRDLTVIINGRVIPTERWGTARVRATPPSRAAVLTLCHMISWLIAPVAKLAVV
jgi:hypothetical protein